MEVIKNILHLKCSMSLQQGCFSKLVVQIKPRYGLNVNMFMNAKTIKFLWLGACLKVISSGCKISVDLPT